LPQNVLKNDPFFEEFRNYKPKKIDKSIVTSSKKYILSTE